MYKLFKLPNLEPATGVVRIADNAYIPDALDNSDYQQYLEWLAEGNTPLPAEE